MASAVGARLAKSLGKPARREQHPSRRRRALHSAGLARFIRVAPPPLTASLMHRAGLEDCAAWREFDRGNASREQHEQPTTVLATKDAGV
ncbi:hypothetical protein JCM18899A_46360 [Nocardioides sp. AN3]